MKYIIFLVGIMSVNCWGDVDVERHIQKLNPKLEKEYVKKVARSVSKYSNKYKLPKRLFTAIIMQESSFNLKAKNCKTGLNDKHESVRVCFDYGLTQINVKTIKAYKFDINKLTTNIDYSVEAGAIVLSWFKKTYSSVDKDWYLRYNIGTGLKTSGPLAQEYKRKINQWM